MNLEDVKKFTKEVGYGILATTDGSIVGARPMSGWAWKDSQFWCATGESSDKVAQLRKVPYAEYCFTNSQGKHVRIAALVPSAPTTMASSGFIRRYLR